MRKFLFNDCVENSIANSEKSIFSSLANMAQTPQNLFALAQQRGLVAVFFELEFLFFFKRPLETLS